MQYIFGDTSHQICILVNGIHSTLWCISRHHIISSNKNHRFEFTSIHHLLSRPICPSIGRNNNSSCYLNRLVINRRNMNFAMGRSRDIFTISIRIQTSHDDVTMSGQFCSVGRFSFTFEQWIGTFICGDGLLRGQITGKDSRRCKKKLRKRRKASFLNLVALWRHEHLMLEYYIATWLFHS